MSQDSSYGHSGGLLAAGRSLTTSFLGFGPACDTHFLSGLFASPATVAGISRVLLWQPSGFPDGRTAVGAPPTSSSRSSDGLLPGRSQVIS